MLVPIKAEPGLRNDLYKLATDFPYFVQTVEELVPGQTCPQLHVQMAEALVAGHDFVSLSGFRAAAKSYIVMLYCSWRIWLDPSIEIIGAAGESKRAKQFSIGVATTLHETPWLKHLSPMKKNMLLGESWYAKDCERSEFPTFSQKNATSNFRGPRAALVILDDALSSTFKYAMGYRDLLSENLQDIPRMLHPQGQAFRIADLEVPQYAKTRCIALYTPTQPAPGNFYGKSTTEKDCFWNRFTEYKFPAVLDADYDAEGELIGGKTAWDKFPMSHWLSEYSLNPYGFRLEFMVDDTAMPDDKSLIYPSKLKTETATPAALVCLVDPAGGGGDEYAYAVGGLVRGDAGSRLHIKEVGGYRNMLPDEIVIKLLDRLDDLGCKRIIVEDNYPGSATIRNAAIERKQSIVIETFKTTIANGSKEDRLKMRLPSYLHGSSVSFAPAVLQDGETIGQMALLRSTRGLPKRRDRLDTICMICDHYQDHIRTRAVDANGKRPKRKVAKWKG